MTDMSSPSWDRFQEAQRKLNLVKAHAHDIVGVKREQVHMVVENFSKPGTYDITVHQDGRVYTAQWTPPPANVVLPEDITPEIPVVVPPIDVVEVPDEPVVEVIEDVISIPELPTEGGLVEESAVVEEPHAPEPAAAPRRRGRPAKKHV